MNNSQTQEILSWLKQGHEITPLEALLRFKCMRLSARILDIKDMGIEIADRWIEKDGKRYKAYRLGITS